MAKASMSEQPKKLQIVKVKGKSALINRILLIQVKARKGLTEILPCPKCLKQLLTEVTVLLNTKRGL
jgi:hypothetical protein